MKEQKSLNRISENDQQRRLNPRHAGGTASSTTKLLILVLKFLKVRPHFRRVCRGSRGVPPEPELGSARRCHSQLPPKERRHEPARHTLAALEVGPLPSRP